MQHRLVPHADLGPEGQRDPRVGVQHRSVLHVRARADGDHVVVAANHRIEPDRALVLENHAADDRRVGRDEVMPAAQLDLPGSEGIEHGRRQERITESYGRSAGYNQTPLSLRVP